MAGAFSSSFLTSSLISQELSELLLHLTESPHIQKLIPMPNSPTGSPAMPTLLFEPDDLRVRAKAVPGSAVINGLEISPDNVADGQRGDDALIRAHRLHCIASGCPRLQHVLLPGPSLSSERRVSLGQVCPL